MNGVAFDGIGYDTYSFNGSFNGDSKTISNVTISLTRDGVGFFGRLDDATVKNLVLDGVSTTGNVQVGVLAGWAYNTSIANCLVLNSSISGTDNDYVGIIVGKKTNGTLSANYYHGCTFLGTANATNVGVGDSNGTGSPGAHDAAGARSVHTLAVPEHVIVSGGETVVIDQVTYYAAGVAVTLAPEASCIVLANVSVNGTAATPNGDGTWSFTMPAADATVTANVGVPYIDENGDTRYCPDFTLIGSSEGNIELGTYNTEGWFVVSGNVTINGQLMLLGSNDHLILCDGATLTVNTPTRALYIPSGSLTIYCQTQGTGAINATSSNSNTRCIHTKFSLTINGGNISVNSNSNNNLEGIFAAFGDITINGGTVKVINTNKDAISADNITINDGVVHAETRGSSSFPYGIYSQGSLTINGGKVNAYGNNYGIYSRDQDLTLGWTNATDSITANRYGSGGTIKVKDGQSLWNGSEVLSGTISNESMLNGKTLVPGSHVGGNYVRITSLDQLTDNSRVIIAARYNEDTNRYYAMRNYASGHPKGDAFTSETSGNDEIFPDTITDKEATYSWLVNVTNDGYTFTNDQNQMIGWNRGLVPSINTEWTITRDTAAASAMVPGYTGFVITNIYSTTDTPNAFAFDGKNSYFGAYATSNMNNKRYNFYLDFFVYTLTGTLNITGYGESTASDHWAFIASPVTDILAPGDVTDLVADTVEHYDLYRLNPSNSRWENWKAHDGNAAPGFSLENGLGYLYANKNDVTLTFPETVNTATEQDVPVSAGYNLVGNPFCVPAYLNQPYYTLNGTGSIIEPVMVNNAIMPCTGVIVQAAADGNVHFSTTAPMQQSTGGNKGSLSITLSQVPEPVEGPARNGNTSSGVGVSTGSTTLTSDSRFASLRGGTTKQSTLDNAIITFSEGSELGKFYFGEQDANIYLPQGNEDYAIAYSEGQGEMPLNFKATKNGTYTITVNPEGVELEYLHLIDNLTGADVDLLTPLAFGHPLTEGEAQSGAELGEKPSAGRFPPLRGGQGESKQASYTFQAKTTDYASRFKLVFGVEDGPSTGSGPFAYIDASGNIIVNGDPSTGSGTLQVIDVMGRIVWVGDAINRVSTSGMMPGVYVLRLIDGDKVRTQKIVIE